MEKVILIFYAAAPILFEINIHNGPFAWNKPFDRFERSRTISIRLDETGFPVVNRVNLSLTSVYTVTYQIQNGGDEQGTSFAMCKMTCRRQQHGKIHLFGLSLCYIFKCALLSRLSLATELL